MKRLDRCRTGDAASVSRSSSSAVTTASGVTIHASPNRVVAAAAHPAAQIQHAAAVAHSVVRRGITKTGPEPTDFDSPITTASLLIHRTDGNVLVRTQGQLACERAPELGLLDRT